MAPPESGPSSDEEPEHESPRAKKWAYLAALQSLGGIERQQQKVREDLRQGRIRPSEALRREEELRVHEQQARKTVEMSGQEYVAHTPGEAAADSASENVFRRTDGGWEIRYAGGALFRVSDTNGARAAAYLLYAWAHPPYPDVRYPMGGAAEVRGYLKQDASVPTPLAKDQGVSEEDEQKRKDLLTLLKANEEQQKQIAVESESPTLDDGSAEELQAKATGLAEEGDEIQAKLNKITDRWGRIRRPRSQHTSAVGGAIRRFLIHIGEIDVDLFDHLKEALKEPNGLIPRYEPDEDISWKVTV